MTQSIEKCYEHDIDLNILFIDFKQAFDSLTRPDLIEDMKSLDIPIKLIKLTKMTMQESTAAIITDNAINKNIEIASGARPGDSISTSLFNVAIEGTIRATEIKGAISYNIDVATCGVC